MGMEIGTAMLISALIAGGSSAAAAGMSGGDEPESFSGTGADPEDWLSELRTSLQSVLGGTMDRAGQPIDLNWTNPQALGSHPTSYIPKNIGANFGTPQRVPVSAGFRPTGPVGFGAMPTSQAATSKSKGLPRAKYGYGPSRPSSTGQDPQLPAAPTNARVTPPTKAGYPPSSPSAPSASALPNAAESPQQQGQAAAQLLLHSLLARQAPGVA